MFWNCQILSFIIFQFLKSQKLTSYFAFFFSRKHLWLICYTWKIKSLFLIIWMWALSHERDVSNYRYKCLVKGKTISNTSNNIYRRWENKQWWKQKYFIFIQIIWNIFFFCEKLYWSFKMLPHGRLNKVCFFYCRI